MIATWFARMHVRLLLVLAAVLPALAIIVNTGIQRRREAMAASGRLALATRQRDMIKHVHEALQGLALAPEVRQLHSTRGYSRWLARVATLGELYGDLIVAGRDGKLLCSAKAYEGRIDVSDHAYFRRALERRNFAIGDFNISRASGQPIVVFARPVCDERDEITAVIALAATAPVFEALLRELSLSDGSVVTIVDSQGVILARLPDPDGLAGRTIPELAEFKAAIVDASEVVTESVWLDRVSRVAAIVPVLSTYGDLYVRVGIPTAMTQAHVLTVVRHNVLLLIGAAALVLVFGWVAAQRLALRRVRDLAETARRLGAGELHARCTLPPEGGELGELARTLDDMAVHMEESMTRLQTAAEEIRLRNRAIDASRNGLMIYRYATPAGVASANPARHALLAVTSAKLAAIRQPVDLAQRGLEREGCEQLTGEVSGCEALCRWRHAELGTTCAAAAATRCRATISRRRLRPRPSRTCWPTGAACRCRCRRTWPSAPCCSSTTSRRSARPCAASCGGRATRCDRELLEAVRDAFERFELQMVAVAA